MEGRLMISVELLRKYPYFAGVGEDNLKALALISHELPIEAGETIFTKGDPAQALFLVISGEVDIILENEAEERFIVDTVPADHMLGWSAVVEPYEDTATGIARTDGKLLSIDAKYLRELLEHDPLMGFRMMQQVAGVLRHRMQAARVLVLSPMDEDT